ncbi:MAG: molybdopterin-binding protein [Spirochaetaceae bacterium]|jgi:hypothetical protein|nr:molybdopterin-binding protein [Spirochaetaceae bacterium]
MQKIAVQEAIGKILCHDLSRIVKDQMKGPQFKKGHIIREEDIPMLLSMGKEQIYVWEDKEGFLHEDEAAKRLAAICRGKNIRESGPSEGKIELYAEIDGLFCVNPACIDSINALGEIALVTRRTYSALKKGELIAGLKAIPLLIAEEKIKEAESIAKNSRGAEGSLAFEPLLNILPYFLKSAAIITTGSEVAKGLIKDTLSPVVQEKLTTFGIDVISRQVSDDKRGTILAAIEKALDEKPDLILCTGGMSVDPDDNTPGAIKEALHARGGSLVSYGAPVFPGAMFLLAYFSDGTPILGLPACVMYAKTTIFDILLPRLAAGVKITRDDITKMGHGGLCLSGKGCPPPCHFPNCFFG